MFDAGLNFPSVIGLHLGKLLRAEDRLIVKDAVEFKGKLERRDVDVEFSVDSVFSIEVKLKGGIEFGKFHGQPDFKLGDTSARCFVSVVIGRITGRRAEMLFASRDLAWSPREDCPALDTWNILYWVEVFRCTSLRAKVASGNVIWIEKRANVSLGSVESL